MTSSQVSQAQAAYGLFLRATSAWPNNVSTSATIGRGQATENFTNIATGYDHLLFLLALILCGGSLKSLVKIITAFTVAHSITLGAAALELVSLPSALVESVIALSIAYVAFENLFPRYALSRRWMISFAFGLVHCFGFSSVLQEIGLPRENLVWALLNFNLGVEAGQLVAVLIAVPALLWLKKQSYEQRVIRGLSWLVMLAGLGWFIERLMG
jgi:hypothetical protein